MPREALVDRDMVAYRVRVPAREVVFVRGLLEASEGLACMFADEGGDLLLAAPRERDADLVAFIEDLRSEMNLEMQG